MIILIYPFVRACNTCAHHDDVGRVQSTSSLIPTNQNECTYGSSSFVCSTCIQMVLVGLSIRVVPHTVDHIVCIAHDVHHDLGSICCIVQLAVHVCIWYKPYVLVSNRFSIAVFLYFFNATTSPLLFLTNRIA